MAEDSSKESRTEAPTPKKLGDEFQEGHFPKAQEVGVVFILVGSFMYLSLQAPALAQQVCTFSRWIWGHLNEFQFNETSAVFFMVELYKTCMTMVLPFVLTCCVAAILAGGLQTGFQLTPNVLKFDMGRINIVNGFQGLLDIKPKIVNFGISLLKFIVVGWIVSGVLKDIQRDPIFYTSVSVQHIADFMYKTFLAMMWKLILCMGAIAFLNYSYNKWQFMENMKMTKQEVADERKDSDGDPKVKSRRRKMAMQSAYRRIYKKVPLADVVVTNPTHFAVALKYERGKDSAPVVVAKGKDMLAKRIKEIAAAHDVPLVENKPVARALYKAAEVDKPIPAALFAAVAQILAFVYRAHRYYFHRLKARRLEAEV